MKKSFLLVCVTYNSYKEVDVFVSSVESAAGMAPDMDVTVAIGDNTVKNAHDINICSDIIKIENFPYHVNLGYLGCAFRILTEIGKDRLAQYDYVAISNVDMTLDKSFFSNLLSFDNKEAGWIAPDIYTPERDTHENPFMMHRPTKMHFVKWQLMYAFPLLYGVMKRISYHRHSVSAVAVPAQTQMYAGHGSFMLFTQAFISTFKSFEYPSFMYAEEIFFAELLWRYRLKVIYVPEMKISNVGSVSVSMLGNSWECRNNRKSLRVMQQIFFKNE